jgi:6-phosphogluconolactonase (cycloisomerase 2 family)
MPTERTKQNRAIIVGVITIALGIVCTSSVARLELTALGTPTASPQLLSIEEIPDTGICLPDLMAALHEGPAVQNLFAELRQEQRFAPPRPENTDNTTDVSRPAVRTLRDTDPEYSSIAVDLRNDEVVLQDNNLWSTRVFNRIDNTPSGATLTEPKRIIQGSKTLLQFNNGLYIDQNNGDIYSVESDVGDKMVVFSHNAEGNVAPVRVLKTPHRGYAIAVNEEKEELYLTVEYPPKVLVYKKTASGDDKPLRMLEGDHTGLEAIHGIALDVKNNVMFVNNWGNASNFKVAGTGKFNPPSIKVYALGASGDTAALRAIQGPKTQLNWPGSMSLDAESGELYVANDVNNSIIVFNTTDQGDVAPKRVIRGKKTGLKNPTGIFVDKKHGELWVSNLGNASATSYPLTASGDVAPLRTIRSAPADKVSLKFGRTEAVAYDSKRQELLVPN